MAASVGSAKAFWSIIKSVSVAEIARESRRPVSIAIAGPPEQREEIVRALFTPVHADCVASPQAVALPESPVVEGFDSLQPEAGFPQGKDIFDLVIDVSGQSPDAPEGVPVYPLQDLGGWEGTIERILDDRPELALPLARSFPAFRPAVARRIIAETASANAQFTLLTGISAALPITAILLPVNTLSDMVILTKNQAMMVLRLAAAYGLPVDYRSRARELGPLLMNAFGWRTVARQLVGLVPVAGLLTRAMIAYAGTVTAGKVAQIYYETGESLSTAHIKHIYQEAYVASGAIVRRIASTLQRRSQRTPPSQPPLPPSMASEPSSEA
ncbi:MAG: hypothetical protein RMJ43_09725 [Chloroherpetonaceae bacterium]|nr:hypothetical protein [Chthonomonadaceae bacterium]MDW8208104.1 hypothetical protein [Chloroherpetonaceae bacterium]